MVRRGLHNKGGVTVPEKEAFLRKNIKSGKNVGKGKCEKDQRAWYLG